MISHLNGVDRPVAYVRFYAALRQGLCSDRSLAALRACARHKIPQRWIALRVEADLPAGDLRWCRRYAYSNQIHGCSSCEAAAAGIGSAAAKRVFAGATSLSDDGDSTIAYLHLFEAPGTARQAKLASKARDAAARALARLGYTVTVTDDDGGTKLVRPTAKWKRSKSCDYEHIKSQRRAA